MAGVCLSGEFVYDGSLSKAVADWYVSRSVGCLLE